MKLEKDEYIILEVRKHWYLIATELSVIAIIALAPFFVALFFSGTDAISRIDFGGNFWALFLNLYSLWLLACWIFSFVVWTNYYLDVWIITNKKLIDVEQLHLFKREISVLELDKIQDVTSHVHGIMATILNYGKIHVQTAGSQREFIIDKVENPEIVRNTIHETIRNLN